MEDDRVRHLGIIPDGARRWAQLNAKTKLEAYMLAMELLTQILDHAFEFGVSVQSIYLLSKENLNRSREDLEAVFPAEIRFLDSFLPPLCDKWGCSVHHAGMKSLLPEPYVEALNNLMHTRDARPANATRKLYLLAAYNPIDEIQHSIQLSDRLDLLPANLWVNEEVDLVIRTGSGELISNFLPLQTGYAEWVFLPKLFNDLTLDDISLALRAFPGAGQRPRGS